MTFKEPINNDIEIDISEYEQNNKQESAFEQKTKEELQKEIQRLEQMIRNQEEQEHIEIEQEVMLIIMANEVLKPYIY